MTEKKICRRCGKLLARSRTICENCYRPVDRKLRVDQKVWAFLSITLFVGALSTGWVAVGFASESDRKTVRQLLDLFAIPALAFIASLLLLALYLCATGKSG